jgi:hypothetical protein
MQGLCHCKKVYKLSVYLKNGGLLYDKMAFYNKKEIFVSKIIIKNIHQIAPFLSNTETQLCK